MGQFVQFEIKPETFKLTNYIYVRFLNDWIRDAWSYFQKKNANLTKISLIAALFRLFKTYK